MKTRLAKKLACTPINRLALYWIEKFICANRCDARIKKENEKWWKRTQEKQCSNENIENNEERKNQKVGGRNAGVCKWQNYPVLPSRY